MSEAEPSKNGGPRFRRVLLKLSGEALAPAHGNGIDPDALNDVAKEVMDVASLGIELAVVIGAGNILRGSEYEARGMDRSTADQMGKKLVYNSKTHFNKYKKKRKKLQQENLLKKVRKDKR